MTIETEEADTPEVAVVMVGERTACFILGRGPYIENDIEEAGLAIDEIGPTYTAPKEKGLWIWEGHPGWISSGAPFGIDEGGEPIYEGRGNWRRPTPEETSRIVSGDFTLFGEERLGADTEVKSDRDLFAGLTPHVEEKKP